MILRQCPCQTPRVHAHQRPSPPESGSTLLEDFLTNASLTTSLDMLHLHVSKYCLGSMIELLSTVTDWLQRDTLHPCIARLWRKYLARSVEVNIDAAL